MEDDPDQPEAHEATNRPAEALSKLVSYHVDEYDLTAATVVGVLAIETIRRTLHALRVRIGSEEDEDDDDK